MKETKHMCEECFKDSDGWSEIGIIGELFSLIKHYDVYYILSGQGHKGDIIYEFENIPSVDPTFYMTDDEVEEYFKTHDWKAWFNSRVNEGFMMYVDYVVDLSIVLKDFMKATKLSLSQCLFQKCGELVKEYENAK